MYEYGCEVTEVVDGDTLKVRVDLGFGIRSDHKLRLLGLDAPEIRTPQGKAAKLWVTRWFSDNPGPYELHTRKGRETEKYGRYLGALFAANGRLLNDDILNAGHAARSDR